MSLAADTDTRRAQVTSAKKKLRQFRASRSGVHSPPPVSTVSNVARTPPPLNTSTMENTMTSFTMPRRLPSGPKPPPTDETFNDETVKLEAPPTKAQRHNRKTSRSHHRRDSSMASFSFPPPAGSAVGVSSSGRPSIVGVFDMPLLGSSEILTVTPTSQFADDDDEEGKVGVASVREIITTPATPVQHAAGLAQEEAAEEQAIARLSAFSFGSKTKQPFCRPPLFPSVPLSSAAQASSSTNPLLSRPPPFPLDLAASTRDSLSAPRSNSRPLSPTRKRHSHNRSESISLPNLKLGGRPASLGVPALPSPGFTSAPSSPFGEATSRSSRLSTPLNSGSRLKFEPSDKEKEESRRRALDKLTGGPPLFTHRTDEQRHSITLPSFDDDDDFSVTSSRPPSSTTLNSTASSSRPSSFAGTSSGSFNGGSLTSPLPWSTFEESDRWSFPNRFDPNKDEVAFDLPVVPSKTSSVLINSSLGVLAEEDETESDEEGAAADVDMRTGSATSSVGDVTSPTDGAPSAGPTPSRLRELHLVSSSSARRGSNPEVRESFARAAAQSRETPTKSYSLNNRSRPRPLGLDEASVFIANNSNTSPVNRIGRSNSLNSSLGRGRRAPSSRGSSISYKKDDSSNSSRDFSSAGGPGSPLAILTDVSSPRSFTASPQNDFNTHNLPRGQARQSCPRPRSMILGMPSSVLVEVDEEEEDAGLGFRGDGVSNGRPSFESSRDSLDSCAWSNRRDSRDRIDAEMERDALREDVDLWRKRCRGIEDQLEAERRETSRLRERVRKLGDRILQQSASHAPSPIEEREIAQSRLISEMRDQIFSLASSLERERKEKAEALAQAAELQAVVDDAKTPHIEPQSLPTTPKSRPRPVIPKMDVVARYEGQYEDQYEDQHQYEDADDDARPHHQSPSPSPEDPNAHRMRGWGFPQGPVDTDAKQSKRDSFFGLSRARPVRAPKASGSGLGLAWPSQSPQEGHHDLPPILVDDTNRSLITPVSPSRTACNATVTTGARIVSEPIRKPSYHSAFQTPDTSPERPPISASTGGFGLSFLSGYLTLPRSSPIIPTPQPIPRISITPSSVSPKKTMLHLERDVFNARIGSIARGCEIDFRHCCKRCTGDIIEL